MKKVYTLMAASVATLSMFAAPTQPALTSKVESATASQATVMKEYTVREHSDMMKAPAIPDLNNYMAYTYYGRSSADGGEQFCAIEMKQISDTEVMIFGLFHNYGVKATYDATKQTLTMTSGQEIVSAEDWNGEPLNFYVIQIDPDSGTETPVNSITFQYAPNGVQFSDGSIDYVGGWFPPSSMLELEFNTPSTHATSSGYQYGWHYRNFFYPLGDLYPEAGAFTFNASEWTNKGTAKFYDGWFGLAGEEFPYSPADARDVTVYRNNANPGFYLLEQPFGLGSLAASYGYNETPNAMGYIFIDASDPDCVLIRPNILSGLSCEKIFGSAATLEVTSYEGIQYYFDEYTKEEIKDEAEEWGDEIAAMTEEGVITIPKCRFGYVPFVEDENYWIVGNGDSTPLDMIAIIELPAGALGVNGIVSDNENAPKRYYNLQGVEVVNPVEGELVIVKQGSKSSKVIF